MDVRSCRNARWSVAAGLALCALGAEADVAGSPTCPGDGGGITVPAGFCATVFADGIGHPRHLAVTADGTVYVNTWSGRYYGNDRPPAGGFVVALRDTHGTGRADVVFRFGDDASRGASGGTGIALYKGALYVEANDKILRYPLRAGDIAPTGAATIVVDGLPLSGDHPMHPFAIDADGALYVDLGSASNACQVANRMPSSRGHDPCTELETRGGIWRYDANRNGQHFSPRERYATGIRNADGIAVDPTGHRLYATQHGRDQLAENWPKLYQAEQGANLPAEELFRIEQGADYGWPTCYFDPIRRRLVLAPEYGGDGGDAVGICAAKAAPVAYFPAHWAPNDLTFYNGDQFPARYRGGAFIAFHGSWNRAPFPQEGYDVVFVPFADGKPSGSYEVFADGFAGAIKSPAKAAHRPSGVAVGPDGALYVSDDSHGRVWRIIYVGGTAAAAVTTGESRAERSEPAEGLHPGGAAGTGRRASQVGLEASPAARAAGITAAMIALGDRVYHGEVGGASCAACHGDDAEGSPLAPRLTTSSWLWGDGSYAAIVATIRNGVPAPKQHTGAMPPMGGARLNAQELTAVAGYVFALNHPANGTR